MAGRRLLFATCVLLLLVGCASPTQKVSDALTDTPSAPQAVSRSSEKPTVPPHTEEVTVAPSTEPAATPTKTRSEPTPTAQVQSLEIGAIGYGLDSRSLGYAFIVTNPNLGHAVEQSQYQVAAYAEDGTVLKTDSGYITLLLPGERLGVADNMYLPEDAPPIDRVDVQLKPGKFEPMEQVSGFSSDLETFLAGDYSQYVTATIHSPFRQDMTNILASAVAYNDADEIIGGGYTFVDFVPADDRAAVSIRVTVSEAPVRLEVYATFSSLSFWGDESQVEGESLQLGVAGFGQRRSSVGYAFMVTNPNLGYAVERSNYQVAGYAADGTVLATDSGYIELLLPGQELGIAGDIYLSSNDVTIDRLEVQIKPGSYVAAEEQPTFTTERATYIPGDYSQKVTAIVHNPYLKDISDIEAYAVAYGDDGEIIGGGYTYVDFVPAEGQTAVDISVTVSGTPASVEVYAAISILSE